MVHNEAHHAAQLEMWVFFLGKVSSIYLWHWREKKNPTKQKYSPKAASTYWLLMQSTSNLLCHTRYCSLQLSGPQLLSLGIFLSPSRDCSPLQIANWPQKQEANDMQICRGRPNGHCDLSVLVCQWKRSSRIWPLKLQPYWRHSARWGLTQSKITFKARPSQKLVEEPKATTLHSQRESSHLKETSNTEGPALWAKAMKGCQKIHVVSNNLLLWCDGTLSALKAVSKVKHRKYLVYF